MKKNTKKYFKTNLIGFIIGGLLISGVAVYAAITFPSKDVSYSNTTSGLESTNVQGAIDELYTTCTAKSPGEQIIEDAGLEKDPYECRYFFTGANPNNYITFNGETAGWRIISAECDGTIKIIKSESIQTLAWDSSNNNNWNRPASLNTYLNETYYNSLTSTAQKQITSHSFSIGGIIDGNRNDMATQVNNENSTTWSGQIALPTMSEYIRINSNTSQCGTYYLSNYNFNTCKNTNWLFNNKYFWTLTKVNNTNNQIFVITSSYDIRNNKEVYVDVSNVHPTLYISSKVQITGGTGTKSDPYTIE